MSTEIRKIFAERLREAREKAGYKTQAALAEALGVKQSRVGNWESCANFPSHEEIPGLARVLKVSIDWLYGNSLYSTKQPLEPNALILNDLSDNLLNRIDEQAEQEDFASREEYIRHLMRRAVNSKPPSAAATLAEKAGEHEKNP